MAKAQRWVSMFVVVAMLLGMVPVLPAQTLTQGQAQPSYNPYQGVGQPGYDPRYGQGYGKRYDPAYYHPGGTGFQGGYGFTRLIPAAVGGVIGLALGAKFGPVGMLLGGALGFFAGKAISSAVFGDSYYEGNYNYQFQASNKANFIPGAIGAAIGAVLGMKFGILGMAIGGGLGFLAAKTVARVMFPNLYYGTGGYQMPAQGGYYGGGYGNPWASVAPAASIEPGAPAAASTDAGDDLETLRQALYESMRVYKDALVGDDEAAKLSAREGFLGAQRSYFDAKERLADAAR